MARLIIRTSIFPITYRLLRNQYRGRGETMSVHVNKSNKYSAARNVLNHSVMEKYETVSHFNHRGKTKSKIISLRDSRLWTPNQCSYSAGAFAMQLVATMRPASSQPVSSPQLNRLDLPKTYLAL